MQCGHCGGNIAGYIVKKKNLWYYKCRVIGCANNKSAKEIHSTFADVLGYFSLQNITNDTNTTGTTTRCNNSTIDSSINCNNTNSINIINYSNDATVIATSIKEIIAAEMWTTFDKVNQQNTDNSLLITNQLRDLKARLERLEERFIMEDITKEMFYKHKGKCEQEILVLEKELGETQNGVSNLDKCIENAIDLAYNMQELWTSSDYYGKQRLQKLVFPEGISYGKKNNECRTKRVNWVFLFIASINNTLSNKKNGIFSNFLDDAALVVPAGIEPATQGFSVLDDMYSCSIKILY